MCGDRLFVSTNLKSGQGLTPVVDFIEREGSFATTSDT
jgi:hypothetical protein